ncbi:MAG: alpha-amylase family glycosyl hydrolase, partial [Nitrospiraceae bacterium]
FWTDAPPPMEPGQANIFPGEESSVWTYDEAAGQYYYHQFYKFEPDLNVGCPEVQEEIKRVIDFWLSFGISGFRVDAVSHMIDGPDVGAAAASHDPHQILRDMRTFTSGRRADAALLGEADVVPDELKKYFGNGDEMHLLYNFLLDNYFFLGLATQQGEAIRRALRLLPSIPESGQWVNFLRNLDELDLERLSDEERALVFDAFAPDHEMRIFGRGIRRRLAPMFKDRHRIKLAMSLLFSLPGAPLVMYGDEIGMGEDLSLEARNAVRTPMQWSPECNGGFSTAAPDALAAPVVSQGPFAYRHVNVQDQAKDPDSLLNWMKRLIVVRRQSPEWGWGAVRIIETEEPGLFAHECEWKGNRLIAFHNLAAKPCSIRLPRERDTTLLPLLGTMQPDFSHPSSLLEMDAYGFLWLRLTAHHG